MHNIFATCYKCYLWIIRYHEILIAKIFENKILLKRDRFHIHILCEQTHISASVARWAAFLTHARQ